MKRYLVMSIVAVLLVGPVIFLSDNLHCKQDDKAITVFRSKMQKVRVYLCYL